MLLCLNFLLIRRINFMLGIREGIDVYSLEIYVGIFFCFFVRNFVLIVIIFIFDFRIWIKLVFEKV